MEGCDNGDNSSPFLSVSPSAVSKGNSVERADVGNGFITDDFLSASVSFRGIDGSLSSSDMIMG